MSGRCRGPYDGLNDPVGAELAHTTVTPVCQIDAAIRSHLQIHQRTLAALVAVGSAQGGAETRLVVVKSLREAIHRSVQRVLGRGLTSWAIECGPSQHLRLEGLKFPGVALRAAEGWLRAAPVLRGV